MNVPFASQVCMAVSALVSIGAPIGLFLYLRKRQNLKLAPALVGAAAFIIFALILESAVHQVVLKPDEAGNIALRSRPLLYMLYGSFMAGIFEESARFLSFHILKKRWQGFGVSLSYGIGHGGIEAILLAGVAMISNLVATFMINAGNTAAFTAEQIAALASTAPSLFLISGVERLMALAIQISLSVIVWYAVTRKDYRWLYPAAIVLHAVVDFPAALAQTGVLSNVLVLEGLVLVEAVICVGLALFTHNKLKQPRAQISDYTVTP